MWPFGPLVPNSNLRQFPIQYELRSPFVPIIVLIEGVQIYRRAMLRDAWHAIIPHASQPSHPQSFYTYCTLCNEAVGTT